ncbi:MAG: phosphate regulon sensor histidine kinase PhoR [Gammaproteobacteria bacterium]
MSNPWIKEFWRVITLGFLALTIGLIISQVFASLFVAVLVYLGWHIYNLYRLEQWVAKRQGSTPPDGSGIWGEVFYHIYKLQRRNRKRKKKLGNMLARFQESTAAMPDATLVLNSENEIEWCNKAATQLLGLDRKKDVGQRVDNLVRTPAFVTYLMRDNFRRPLEMFSPKNRTLRLSISIVAYGKNKKLMIVRDVTRLYHLERMRRDFVANVSHELKTPLTVINGYLENLLDAQSDNVNEWHGVLDQMHSQGERMQQIVDDLLLLSRLETEEEDTQRDTVAVPVLIATIAEDLGSLVADKQQTLNLEINDELWLYGAEKELYSTFSNLMVNAVKYTPTNGAINVRWYLYEDHPCFEVTDSGIGIAKEHIPRLTERFYRVDTGRSRDLGGTGLGLAIVKHVLLRHNAKLSITSKLGEGSRFKCVFPVDRSLLKAKNQVQGL